jgi:hypothetical protein
MFRRIVVLLTLAAVSPEATAAQSVGALLPPLMEKDREIALALSAAPAHLAGAATVYVLGKSGYERARTGTNGFTCLVDHDRADTVEPVCYDPEGSATLLPVALEKAMLRARGKTDGEIKTAINEGYKAGRFHAPRRPGIAYMLAKEQSVYDETRKKVIPYVPHLMFYAPNLTSKDLGLEPPEKAAPGSPFLIFEGEPGALIIVPMTR